MLRQSQGRLCNIRILCRSAFSRRSFTVLGIETSCDDTCVALIDIPLSSSPIIRHHIIRRTLKLSEPHGGIVPNLVGEFHAKNLGKILCEVRDLGGFAGLDLIAVTRGPGLPMCLASGLNHAKGLSVGLNVPLIGVHHMQAHALTPRLLSSNKEPHFPFYTLLISGGHTLLVHSVSLTNHYITVDTVDTAIGDYIDKVARVLRVPWDNRMPGAALEEWTQVNQVDDRSLATEMERWGLPRPFAKNNKRIGFSFSGLRSAVDRIVAGNAQMSEDERKSLGRASQFVAFQHVAEKCILGIMNADDRQPGGTLVVSGGVACNKGFRRILRQNFERSGLGHYKLIFPPVDYCTDNAAMVAWAGYEMFQEGYISDFEMTQRGKWPLNELMDENTVWRKR